MKKILALLTLLLSLATAFGQTTVNGLVTDTAGKPLAQISVSLLRGDRTVGSTSSSAEGRYRFSNIAAGSYSVKLTGIGFRNVSVPVQVRADTSSVTVPIAKMEPEGKELGAVVVTAQKALVEDKGDRLVYNASADISNAGGTAADVLRKVPSLSVDADGNVQMRGNGNIKVLINGKPSAMMARNLADALRQMPANVIKTIEVIATPGAKYDAEGSAGIINIITKRGLRGFNGSVNATAGDRNRSVGGSLALKRKTIGLNFSGNVYQYKNTSEQSSLRTNLLNGQPQDYLSTNREANNTGTGAYGELAFDWDPDTANHFNVSLNVWGGNFPNNSGTRFLRTALNGAVLESFRTNSDFTNPYGNGQLDVGWTRSFKKPGQEFSLLGQFSRMPDNYFYTTDRIDDAGNIFYREKSDNYSRNKEYTMQADYTHPLKLYGRRDTSDLKIEAGIKTIIRDIGSEVRVQQAGSDHDPLVHDPAQDNDFDYVQRVYSGYTSLNWSNKKRWNITAGARYERTDINGEFATTGTKLRSEYDNLIPSATISKGFGKHTVKLSYSQRITRPQIWYLNPWINRSDPKNQVTGTPDLRPELNHAIELGHSFATDNGFSLNTAIYHRRTDNAIEYVGTRPDASKDTLLSRPVNAGSRAVTGVNVNVSAKPNKDWSLNGGVNVFYIDIRSKALNQRNDGVMWNANLNTNYKIKTYTLAGYGGAGSGWRSLQNTSTTIGYWYGLSVKKSFWDNKGSITASANMPFQRGVRQRQVQESAYFRTVNENIWVSRQFRVTFEWRFGQMGDGGKQGKKISNDDSGGR